MTTKPYSELLAQVEALAGATLALQEQRRVKIFANRRAKDAHRECPYWPRFLRVGEERIVSESGLLPLAETGKETIDQIIRIHRQDPFKQREAFEYTEYYEDANGIQITGYQKNATAGVIISGDLDPDATGFIQRSSEPIDGTYLYSTSGENIDFSDPPEGVFVRIAYTAIYQTWAINYFVDGVPLGTWSANDYPATPGQVSGWNAEEETTGSPTVVDVWPTAFVTYLAAPADTYGDGEGEEANVPEEWFEYMAQGAYCDWLRSDGQTEKALAEEAIAAKLLGQQLEKVSRQNGNQVITRNLNHSNTQRR